MHAGDPARPLDDAGPHQVGYHRIGGSIPVNPSGGVLSANPVGATVLIRVAEAAMQVMGEAGEHQIENVRTALATGYGGNAWTDLLVLRSEKP